MNLQDVKQKIPHTFIYRGKHFSAISYSREGGFGKNKQRSKEIIWESRDGSTVYLYGNSIEYLE